MSTIKDITIHNTEDFISMREAGSIAAGILDYITPFVQPGVSTVELNDLCHAEIIRQDCIPAPLNYRGFPKSICTSVNHVVCHGIPGDKILRDGDILNIDVTVIKNGWHGDTSRMYFVGKNKIIANRLVKTCYDSLMKAVDIVKDGVPFNLIGKVIQEHVESNGYSVVRDYCGHGIGKVFHASPNVVHYYEPKNSLIMQEGMFFTIEPMINVGKYKTKLLSDQWTVVTIDRSLSAQFEHTIGVTKNGCEVFTASKKGFNLPPYK